MARAERFYSAKRWADAKSAFAALSPGNADQRELVALRLAASDYYLGNRRQAREALRPLLDSDARGAEARYISLLATKALGDRAGFVRQARELASDFPRSPWAEEALNGLATDYITADEDDEADGVFRELLRLFPRGRYAERAAWKVGWRSYRAGEFSDAAAIFESAAAAAPRADNRPAWLYWAGRARDRLDEPTTANARYRLVVADYQNSYYGRLSSKILVGARPGPSRRRASRPCPSPTVAPVVESDDIIRSLLTAQMYGEALREVQYAQRVWGDSPQLQATSAWIRHQQGLLAHGRRAVCGAARRHHHDAPGLSAVHGRRRGSAAGRRAAHHLPARLLAAHHQVLRDAQARSVSHRGADGAGVDVHRRNPLARERLRADADHSGHGPALRAQAGHLAVFNTAMLRQPEINVRIGTQYFRDLIDRFGGAHFALASYNAGESRVDRWTEERPGIPQDEFIDDIPFPETQNYVKRILGTAEDYR